MSKGQRTEGIFLPGGGQQRFCQGGQVPAFGHFAFQAGVVVLALKGQCDAEQVDVRLDGFEHVGQYRTVEIRHRPDVRLDHFFQDLDRLAHLRELFLHQFYQFCLHVVSFSLSCFFGPVFPVKDAHSSVLMMQARLESFRAAAASITGIMCLFLMRVHVHIESCTESSAVYRKKCTKNGACFFLLQRGDQLVDCAGDAVEEFVHEFGFLHFGDVDEDAAADAGHPAGLGVGAAAAGEDEDAGVGPAQGVQVGGELAFGFGVVEAFGVLGEGPVRGGRVDVGPVEAGAAVGRVAEVVDFVARLAQAPYDFGVVLVSPAGGYVDLCHNLSAFCSALAGVFR